jgi:hypothetical protein
MGLCITLENEGGETSSTLTDDKNLLHKLLPSQDDESFPMLTSIDWYGNTVFNAVQMKRFLSEWEHLTKRASTAEEKALTAGIKALALRCQDEVHHYLKFIGD